MRAKIGSKVIVGLRLSLRLSGSLLKLKRMFSDSKMIPVVFCFDAHWEGLPKRQDFTVGFVFKHAILSTAKKMGDICVALESGS